MYIVIDIKSPLYPKAFDNYTKVAKHIGVHRNSIKDLPKVIDHYIVSKKVNLNDNP